MTEAKRKRRLTVLVLIGMILISGFLIYNYLSPPVVPEDPMAHWNMDDWADDREYFVTINETHARSKFVEATYNPETDEYSMVFGVQAYVYDGEFLVPYVLDTSHWLSDEYITIKSGLIGAILRKGGLEYYDPNMTSLAVGRENWVVFKRVGDEWRPVCSSLRECWTDTWVNETTDYVNITSVWQTDAGELKINYHFYETMKHTVTWKPNSDGEYAVVQFWNNIQHDGVKLHNATIIRRTDDVIVGKADALTTLFFNDTQPFGIFENNDMVENLLHKVVFAGGTVNWEGIKFTDAVGYVYYNSSLCSLSGGESLEIDPTTSTYYSTTKDGYVYKKQYVGSYLSQSEWDYVHDASYGSSYSYSGSSSYMGPHKSSRYLYIYRAFFYFGTSSLPDSAEISSASLHLYGYYYAYSSVCAMKGTQGSTLSRYDYDEFSGSEYGHVRWHTYQYNVISFNSQGRSDISKTGTTKICCREYDYDYRDIRTSSRKLNGCYSADYSGTSRDPKLVVTYTTNHAPTNDYCNLEDPDAGRVLCKHKYYDFLVKATDADGPSDLDYVELRLETTNGVWGAKVKWTQSANTFSVTAGSGYISISGCSKSQSGNQVQLHFKIMFDWDYPVCDSARDVQVYSEDDYDASDTDTYSNEFTVEDDLTFSNLAVSDYRCNPSQSLTFSGKVHYQGTSITPPNGNYNVKIKLGGAQKGSTDTTLVSGQFSITANAESAVNSHSYTAECDHMASAGGFNPVIVDRFKVSSMTNDDERRNVGTQSTIIVNLIYEYDSSPVTTGSFTVNGYSLTHISGSTWRAYVTKSSVQKVTFNGVSGSGDTYDLNTVNQNGKSTSVILDRIEIYYEVLDDSRVNINDDVEFRVKARLDYDNHALGSGDSLTANFGAMSWDATNSWFDRSRTQGTVGDYTFTITSGNEATYGITTIYESVSNPKGIWDQIKVTFTVDHNELSTGETATFTVSMLFDYDESPVTDYSYGINRDGWARTYTTSTFTDSESFPASHIYDFTGVTDNSYGITAFVDPSDLTVTWSTLEITITLATSPTGLNVRLDGGSWFSAPHSWDVDPGGSHSIEVQSPQSGGVGIRYVWVSWSDSGNNPHNVAPSVDTTYTATFTHQWYFEVDSAYDAPTGEGWYDDGASVHSTVTTPSEGHMTMGWTGTGSLASGGTEGSSDTGLFTINEYSTCVWNWKGVGYVPDITSLTIVSNGAPITSLNPLQGYEFTVGVEDLDRLSDLKRVVIYLWSSEGSEGSYSKRNGYGFEWVNSGGSWSVTELGPGGSLNPALSTKPDDLSATSGEFTFHVSLSGIANPTGWTFKAYAYDSQDASDDDLMVFSVKKYLCYSVSTHTVNWGTLDPGTSNQIAIAPSGGLVTVSITCNYDVKIQIRGSGDLVSGSHTIPLSNVYVGQTSDPANNDGIKLSTSYQDFKTGIPYGENRVFNSYWFLSIPEDQYGGDYSFTWKIQVVEE